MGYLAQKKKNHRENLFLIVMALVLSMFSFAALVFDWGWLKSIVFHLYVLSAVVWGYSLFIARFGISLLFLLFVVVNYFHVASLMPIFFDQKIDSANVVSVKSDANSLSKVTNDGVAIPKQGFLTQDGHDYASFLTIDNNGSKIIFLAVNMKGFNAKKIKKNLRVLRDFVLKQNDSVFIVGDFGISPWEKSMKKFLIETGLEIKNSLISLYTRHEQKFWNKPSFFVLGFKNVGISKMDVTKQVTNKENREIHFEIAIN